MAKTYTKEEIKNLLKENFKAVNVYQLDCDYDDEYRVQISEEQEIQDRKHIEVVSLLTAIKNEEDFSENKHEFLSNIIEALVNEEEIVSIGDYSKLADNLFWREF